MAHELQLSLDGTASMAYVGAMPWHGLGQKLTENATIEDWRREAKLDWHLHRSTVQFMNGEMHDFPEHHVLYRSDSNAPLAVVSDRYKVVQPGEVLEFFRDLVAHSGFTLETAGSLKGGRRIWALARTGFDAEVVDNDPVKNYLLLATSCDGSLATTAQFTSVRVVCNNTLHLSLHGAQAALASASVIKVRHNTEFDPTVVQDQLGLIGEKVFGSFIDRMKNLSRKPVSAAQADAVLQSLMSSIATPDVTKSRGYKTVMGLFNGAGKGAGLDGVRGTAWGLLNAVTEYHDFHIRARGQDNRLNSAWFGIGANAKEKALKALEAL